MYIYIYNSVFLHADSISLTPPRARHPTLRKLLWRKLVTLMSACWGRNYNFRCINVVFWRVFARDSAPVVNNRTNLAQLQEIYQTAGPIDTKFGTHVQIHLGMDICQTNWTQMAFLGVLGGHKSMSGRCQTARPIGTKISRRLRIRLGMDIG